MNSENPIRSEINNQGFAVVKDIFSDFQIKKLLSAIERADTSQSTFRKTKDLFAIRQFLKEVPGSVEEIFTPELKVLISTVFGSDYFAVKSIYFDKPQGSNWFVAYHQDLTISVAKKLEIPGFGPWTRKQGQFAVQPPLEILEDNFTIRIHLDDTDENNGALKVFPGSHLKGVYRPGTIDHSSKEEAICVPCGGIMFMKPLLMHSSGRSSSSNKRRVIHIELSRLELPGSLSWSEKYAF